ncbi:MAG: class I SAM-dependent methyltransferase [Candidatus Acidiferrales bacterium]
MSAASQFDKHAGTYDAELNQALAASGEDKNYFALERVNWLKRSLQQLQELPGSAIDYGCGIGDTAALLRDAFNLNLVTGLDVSLGSLERARLQNASACCQFLTFHDFVPQANVDVVYCNGVFHHIPVAERASSLEYIRRCLRPGGLFALWENNPWNPGTRYVMSQCSFDHDAITISPPQAVLLLRAQGFQVISIHYLFFFPRFLKLLRFLEPHFSRIPLGAQYQILCRKPAS